VRSVFNSKLWLAITETQLFGVRIVFNSKLWLAITETQLFQCCNIRGCLVAHDTSYTHRLIAFSL